MDLNATLFGQMITFAIFVWFTMRFVWPMLEANLNERQAKIAEGLAAAEKGRQALLDSSQQAASELAAARERGRSIVKAAENEAAEILREAKERAEAIRETIIKSGETEVQEAVVQARKALQSEIANIVVMGAEKILTTEIDSGRHKQLLDKLSSQFV